MVGSFRSFCGKAHKRYIGSAPSRPVAKEAWRWPRNLHTHDPR